MGKEEMFQFAEEAIRLSNSLVDKFNRSKPLATWPQVLMMVFVAKSRKSARALLLLAREGYKEDIQSVLRTIFENIVNMNFILQQSNPEYWAMRYIEFQIFSSKKYADKYLKHGKDEDIKAEVMKQKEKLEKEIEDLQKKYGKKFGEWPYTWSGKTLRDMAYECKMEFHYDLLYSLWSDFAHASIQSTRDYTEEVDGELQIVEKPNYEVEKELSALIEFMVRINDSVNMQLNLIMESKLETFKERYIAARSHGSKLE